MDSVKNYYRSDYSFPTPIIVDRPITSSFFEMFSVTTPTIAESGNNISVRTLYQAAPEIPGVIGFGWASTATGTYSDTAQVSLAKWPQLPVLRYDPQSVTYYNLEQVQPVATETWTADARRIKGLTPAGTGLWTLTFSGEYRARSLERAQGLGSPWVALTAIPKRAAMEPTTVINVSSEALNTSLGLPASAVPSTVFFRVGPLPTD